MPEPDMPPIEPGRGRLRYDKERRTIVSEFPKDDLCAAPGADDLTFGSLLCEMIRWSFTRVDGRMAPGGRHYAECNYCGGNDVTRPEGQRPGLDHVIHQPDCSLAKHLPRLMAMANKGVT